MNILVTGGAGYIGSHTAKALARAGFQPIVLDNLSAGYEANVKWGPLVRADIADADAVRTVLRDYQIQAVMHFAARINVGESMDQPRLYFESNTITTFRLLDAMLACGVKRFIFSSTCALYGDPERLPLDEQHPQRPLSPYGESKRMVEQMMAWLQSQEGLQSVSLRYFNAAGADPEGELGEAHVPETHLIPLTIYAAHGRNPNLRVNGSDYSTPDGTAVRDYIHVADLAEAHLAALRHLLDGGASTAVNLGTGQGSSIREVIAMVERVSGRSVPRQEGPRRPGDPAVLVAANAKAREVLHWEPRLSDLQTIIETAWRWHSSQESRA